MDLGSEMGREGDRNRGTDRYDKRLFFLLFLFSAISEKPLSDSFG